MPEKRLYQSFFIAIRAAQSTTYNYTPQMFPASVMVISKVAGRVSVVESLTSKVTEEIFAVYNSPKNSVTWIVMFRKAALA